MILQNKLTGDVLSVEQGRGQRGSRSRGASSSSSSLSLTLRSCYSAPEDGWATSTTTTAGTTTIGPITQELFHLVTAYVPPTHLVLAHHVGTSRPYLGGTHLLHP